MMTIKAKNWHDEPVTADVLEKAIVRGQKRKSEGLHAMTVKYMERIKSLLICFADESGILLPVNNYVELTGLTTTELKHLTVGFGGTALCLDEKDLHISIAGMVSSSRDLLKMALVVAATNSGSVRSAAKARASQENGRKGGRPRTSVLTV